MKQFYIPLKYALMPLIITVISGGLFLFQEHTLPVLEFSRNAIEQGEWWRLITGNLMHSNHWHLLLNLGGLLLATLLVGHLFSWQHFLALFISNGLMVGVLIYYFNPDITYYVGLSGYSHGLFIYGALLGIYHSYYLKQLLNHRSFDIDEKDNNHTQLVTKWRRRAKFDGETYWMLLIGIIGKVAYEQFFGASDEMSELINANVATDAHLYGAAVAMVQFVKLVLIRQIAR